MIVHEMYCEYCGKTFFEKCGIGNYIDHYENFARIVSDDEVDATAMICDNGNEIRDAKDIEERLKCFLAHSNISDETKNAVKARVNEMLGRMREMDEWAEEVCKGRTALERRILYKHLLVNCGVPMGNEDGKMDYIYKKEFDPNKKEIEIPKGARCKNCYWHDQYLDFCDHFYGKYEDKIRNLDDVCDMWERDLAVKLEEICDDD